jgi:putative toxin-antitoxin system antitoxin component (TIGR02293 family)
MLKTHKTIPRLLKQKSAATPLELIERSKKGIKGAQFIKYQKESPLFDEEWSHILNLTIRTLYRYRTENKTFDKAASERILEVMGILEKGWKVFGSKEKFNMWLRIPSIALGGKAPIEFFDTSTGIQYIKDELGRIEYGVFA